MQSVPLQHFGSSINSDPTAEVGGGFTPDQRKQHMDRLGPQTSPLHQPAAKIETSLSNLLQLQIPSNIFFCRRSSLHNSRRQIAVFWRGEFVANDWILPNN